MITTYSFYKEKYYGDIIPEDLFPKYESRAEDELLLMTQERVAELQEMPLRVQKADCALAEVIYQIDMAAQQSGVDTNGKGKIIKSVSSGGESISYDTGKDMFSAVLGDEKAQNRLKYDTVRKHLTGTGLLYLGV